MIVLKIINGLLSIAIAGLVFSIIILWAERLNTKEVEE